VKTTTSKKVEKKAAPIRVKKVKPVEAEITTPGKVKQDFTINTKKEQSRPTGDWSLSDCINYGLSKNLQISETALNARLAELTYEQSKYSRLPNLNGDASLGYSFGRSIDPTTNQFVNQGFLFNNAGINSQVLVFGFFRKQHEIEQNNLLARANVERYEQIQDDVSLNIATAYLRVLLAREQTSIANKRLQTNEAQLQQTIVFVNAGSLPVLNKAQMESTVASDKAAVISAQSEEQIALLQLKALMNLDFEEEFDIAEPSLDAIQMFEDYRLTDPSEIYEIALGEQHAFKSGYYNLRAAQKSLDLAKAAQYPSLFFGVNINTSFSSNFLEIIGQNYVGQQTLGFVNVAGTQFPVESPQYDFTTRTIPYFNQFGNNIRSNAALSVQVPIFNGYSAKTNIERARLGLSTQRLAMETQQLNLKQDIYRAHQEAVAALAQYESAVEAEKSALVARNFAIRRFEVGRATTFEYTQSQTAYNQASSSALSAKYDLLFKLKVLDYYFGIPLKL